MTTMVAAVVNFSFQKGEARPLVEAGRACFRDIRCQFVVMRFSVPGKAAPGSVSCIESPATPNSHG